MTDAEYNAALERMSAKHAMLVDHSNRGQQVTVVDGAVIEWDMSGGVIRWRANLDNWSPSIGNGESAG